MEVAARRSVESNKSLATEVAAVGQFVRVGAAVMARSAGAGHETCVRRGSLYPLSSISRGNDIKGMSLGIVIKGAEGLVLAADSRVTLFAQVATAPGRPQTLAASNFDNATKLLYVNGQGYSGAVTYGLGVIPTRNGPRTMQSFVPEFEAKLAADKVDRLSVPDFASRLSAFFLERWNTMHITPQTGGDNIEFIVGGYDDGGAYGRAFQFRIPAGPDPVELNAGPGEFGMTFGGQTELAQRIMVGYDNNLLGFLQQEFRLDQARMAEVAKTFATRFPSPVPIPFLPLQDCVDLAAFLLQGTIRFQKFGVGIRGVGGRVDLATITPTKGFEWVAQKEISSPLSFD